MAEVYRKLMIPDTLLPFYDQVFDGEMNEGYTVLEYVEKMLEFAILSYEYMLGLSKGVKGDKGDKGERGDRGLQGVKGDKGDKGDTGTGVNRVYQYNKTLGTSNDSYRVTVIPTSDFHVKYSLSTTSGDEYGTFEDVMVVYLSIYLYKIEVLCLHKDGHLSTKTFEEVDHINLVSNEPTDELIVIE